MKIEKWQQEYGRNAEYGGECEGRCDLLRVRLDHGGNGNDGRVAAYRVAAGDQRCQLRRQAKQPPDDIGRSDRKDDDDGDAGNQPDARAPDRRKADGCAEKDDGDFQQDLGAEIDTRPHAWLQRFDGADDDAECDGKHQAFDPPATENTFLKVLAGIGKKRNGAGQRKAGKNPVCALCMGHFVLPFVIPIE